MAAHEPDRDWGDENAYEAHLQHIASMGLCELCGESEALPNEDFCSDCLAELELDE
jgi:hypothetical protein